MMEAEYNIIRLTPDHNILPFDCGDSDLNDFLINEAKNYQEQLLAVTYLVETNISTVLYFCLSNDKITSIETTNSFWRRVKKLFPHSKHRKDYPAVKIGRLAVDKDFQRKENQYGSTIIDYIKHWMVTGNKTGCRFITVDAYRIAVPFYLRNGFRFMGTAEENRYKHSNDPTIAMYFNLKSLTEED